MSFLWWFIGDIIQFFSISISIVISLNKNKEIEIEKELKDYHSIFDLITLDVEIEKN